MQKTLYVILLLFSPILLAGTYYDPSTLGQLIPPSTNGVTFYVDPVNGNDSNDGSAMDSARAWKTIAKAFYNYTDRNSAGNGVRILLKAGIYREAVSVPTNWTDGTNYETGIILAAHGDGEVIIDPSSTPLAGWTAHDANIYKATWPTAPTRHPIAVILNNDFKRFKPVETLEDVTDDGNWWYDNENYIIYIHTTGVDPATLDPIITETDAVRSLEQYAVSVRGVPYVTISGLTLRGAGKYGLSDYAGTAGNHVKVEHCSIRYNNGNGARLFSSYSMFDRNEIYANMMFNWPRGSIWGSTGGWGQGITISNHGEASGNYSHDNGGEGIGIYGGGGYTLFNKNISINNYSVGLYLDNAPECTMTNNLVYASTPDPDDEIAAWQLPSGSTLETIYVRMRQYGIMIGDETATNATAQGINHKVYNNIIIGTRSGFNTYGQATGSGLKNYYIVSNTIVLPTLNQTYGKYYGIRVDSDNANNTGSIIKNNIVISPTDVTDPLVHSDSGEWVGVAMDNNVYYNVSGTEPFETGSYPSENQMSFADWKTNTSQDTNSLNENPDLDNSAYTSTERTEILSLTSIDINDYYPISADSGIVDIGDTLGSPYNLDWDDTSRPVYSAYDAGAFEYNPHYSVSVTGITGLSESNIVAGGTEVTFTVAGTTWVETIGADNEITTDFLAILDGSLSGTGSWDDEVTLTYAHLVRTSDIVLTLTLPASSGYDIGSTETISIGDIPASATEAGEAITPSPNSFTIAYNIPAPASGGKTTVMGGGSTITMGSGGKTWVIGN